MTTGITASVPDFVNNEAFSELVEGILSAFHGQVIRIVLYGSVARRAETSDSDVDIAVFVPARPDPATEDRLSDVIVDLNLKYNKVFSPKEQHGPLQP